MKNNLKWKILNSSGNTGNKSVEQIVNILLENRGIKNGKQKLEFLNPRHPLDLQPNEIAIDQKYLEKAIKRIRKAIEEQEQIIIYGDYDADGVCATAILWETLYALNKNVRPYIPDRFSEGYGINSATVKKLKSEENSISKEGKELKLIITVDNGIVANDAIDVANSLGIDVIVTDHHQKGKKLPNAFSIIHTENLSGSGISWVLSKELKQAFKADNPKLTADSGLELTAIGTVADQLPLVGPNRSIVKFGLEQLSQTKRPGLLALYEEAGIKNETIGTYEINYLIAPRINAMGRMKNALVSLRLLCTSNISKANDLAAELGSTNRDRQQIVDQVVLHARELVGNKEWKGVIVLAHESYHEGVIGLAAGRLVEEFYRPAIVLSKGAEVSKASARSVSGFNIIENIRKMDSLIIGGGGHPMAAGFSIETKNIEAFVEEFDKLTEPLLTSEILQKRVNIDCKISLKVVNKELFEEIRKFDPTGIGNYAPVFLTEDVNIIETRLVGSDAKHLKMKVEKEGVVLDCIAFNLGTRLKAVGSPKKADIVFNVDENIWNGQRNLQLKVKDIHFT